jgi:hypothetical protein
MLGYLEHQSNFVTVHFESAHNRRKITVKLDVDNSAYYLGDSSFSRWGINRSSKSSGMEMFA